MQDVLVSHFAKKIHRKTLFQVSNCFQKMYFSNMYNSNNNNNNNNNNKNKQNLKRSIVKKDAVCVCTKIWK